MKLIGSKVEREFRDILISSHKALFQDNSNTRLLTLLKNNFPDMKTAYFIGHTPEQDVDIYQMLIDLDTIATVELERYDLNSEPLIKKISTKQYEKRLSKMWQIKLAVAVDLAKKDLE